MSPGNLIKARLKELIREDRETGRRRWWVFILSILLHIYRFIQITIREFLDDRLFLRAMALTFGTLLSIIPLMILSFSMFSQFGGGEWFMDVLRPVLARYLAPGSEQVVALRIEEFMQRGKGTFISGVGLIFLVIGVYGIFSAIETTFNLIWGVQTRRSILSKLPLYWGLITIIPILVVSSLAFTTYLKALPMVNQAVERVSFAGNLINGLLPVVMIIVGFYLLYRFLPDTKVRNYAALTGAFAAGLLYEFIKSGFIFYTGKLVKYNIIYGSVAIIPSLMIWINLSWIMVLLGVEICFVMQHYNLLLTKRKHVEFSRFQKDALAYSILAQITDAFRGKREAVTVEEWSKDFGIPPGIVIEVLDKLQNGNIIKKVGFGENEILLTRDPDFIMVCDIEKILTGESFEEWTWPEQASWQWLKNWMKSRKSNTDSENNGITLSELVHLLENSNHDIESLFDQSEAANEKQKHRKT